MIFPDTAQILKFKNSIKAYETGDIFSLSEKYLDECVKKYSEIIKAKYDENHIIVIEHYAVDSYIDESLSEIDFFEKEDVKKDNERVRTGFSLLKKYFPDSHYVYFPAYTIGDSAHRWGLAPLHFVKEYYDYGIKCIRLITEGDLEPDVERKLLQEEKYKCENLLKTKIKRIYQKKKQLSNNRAEEFSRYKYYEEFFKRLLLDNGKKTIGDFIVSNKINTCAFHGLT